MDKILFFGELPEQATHGISLSNRLNLALLREKYAIEVIVDGANLHEHGQRTVGKVRQITKSVSRLFAASLKSDYACLYLTLSMSTAGALKTLAMVAGYRLLNKSGVVLHVHRGDFFDFYQRRINELIVKMLVPLVSKVVVLDECQVGPFTSVFGPKVEVLENSLSEEYRFGAKPLGSTRFVYISNYIKEKGILDLLEAFTLAREQRPDLTLECYGAVTDESLVELMRPYVGPAITINPPIHGREKFKKIFDSDCLVLPSWNEGQPLVLLEAMSVGTPVIATDVGLVRGELGDGYKYLLKPRAAVSLAETIMAYASSTDKEEISSYLEDRYRSKFSHEEHRKKLFTIFSFDGRAP